MLSSTVVGCIQLNGDGPGHKAGKDPEGAMNGESDEAHTSSLGKERHRAGAALAPSEPILSACKLHWAALQLHCL